MDKSSLVKVATALGVDATDMTVAELNEAIVGSSFVRDSVPLAKGVLSADWKEIELEKIRYEAEFKFKDIENQRQFEMEKLKLELERQDKDRVADLEFKMAQLKQQADLAAISGYASAPQFPAATNRTVRLDRLKDGDDPLVFFAAVEKLFAARNIPVDQQAGQVVELLGPKALDAYSRMSLEDSRDYNCVRATILKRFQISTDAVREKFRTSSMEKGESFVDFSVKLSSWAQAWFQDHNGAMLSAEDIKEVIVMEQFLARVPEDLRTWLLDKKVKTVREAAELSDGYAQVRRRPLGQSDIVVGKPVQGVSSEGSQNQVSVVRNGVNSSNNRGVWNARHYIQGSSVRPWQQSHRNVWRPRNAGDQRMGQASFVPWQGPSGPDFRSSYGGQSYSNPPRQYRPDNANSISDHSKTNFPPAKVNFAGGW